VVLILSLKRDYRRSIVPRRPCRANMVALLGFWTQICLMNADRKTEYGCTSLILDADLLDERRSENKGLPFFPSDQRKSVQISVPLFAFESTIA
jgi:hypothetical protein